MSKSGVTKLKIDDINKFYGKQYPLHFYSDSFKIPMTNGLIESKTSGKPVTQEASILDADGNELWFNSTLIPINDANGHLDYFLVVSSDITARKQAENAALQNSERFRDLVDSTDGIVWEADAQTFIFNYVSKKAERLLGYPIEDWYEEGFWASHIYEADKIETINLCTSYTKQKLAHDFEYRFIAKDGTIFWLRDIVNVVVKNGEPYKLRGIMIDITKLKLAELNLIKSQEKLNEALDITNLGTFVFNDSTDLFITSILSDKILGIDKSYKRDIQGWVDLVHPEDYKEAQLLLDKTNTESITSEFRIIRPNDKKTIWVLGHAKLEFDNAGMRTRITGTIQDISQRKKAEKTIRENQDFNESLLKTTPDIIYVYDLIKKKNVYTNDGNMKVLGYTDSEISTLGENLVSLLLHPDDYEHYINNIIPQYQLAKEGEVIQYENRLKHKNGNWLWLHNKETIFKRENGKAVQIFGIAGDITERKEAEQKLQKAQANLKNTFDISPSIISKANITTGYFINVSSAVTDILGYAPEEFLSKPFLDFIHPDDVQRTNDEIIEKLKGKKVISFENRYLCKDGSYKWIDWQSTAPDENGVVTSVGSDINDKKQVEKDLRSSAERFERWKSSNFIGILQSNSIGDIVDANDTILTMLGYSKKELKEGKLDWTKLTPPEFLDLDAKAIKEAEKKGYWTPFEKEYYHKDGHRIPILIGGSLFKETKNEFIVFIINLTESKKAEKDFKKSEEFLNLTGEIAKVGGWEFDLVSQSAKWSKETKNIHEVAKDYEPNLDNIINFYHPDDIAMVKELFIDAIENGNLFTYEAQINTAKGTQKYIKTTGQPVFKDGKCIRLYGAFQDITERKKIDEELENYRKQLETENVLLKKEISLAFNYEDMVYASNEISDVLTQVEQVATTDATVLILGETGTGKELIAKAIHNTSDRKNNSLIRVNCGAIPAELIESELFGHVKGSFTGAVNNRIGKFELADGGSLFLDEIGELPLALQPKLLRVIQEGEIEPIGSSELRKLDVRIIAATNKNLKQETQEKRFREDLYFRLNVFPIDVPPLRKRIDDISVLTDYFVNKYSKKHGKNIKYISDVTMQQMKSYSWPGNVRELENLIERAVIISNEDVLIMQNFDNSSKNKTSLKNKNKTLNEVQRDHIIKTLNETNWKIDGNNGAADLLDIKPSTLRDRMKKLNIKRK